MEPLPEVVQAIDRLAAETGDSSLLDRLVALCEVAQAVVPACVAVSLTMVLDDEPLTLTATSAELAVLDAAQYLEGGPCLAAAQAPQAFAVPDVLDEHRWELYDSACAAHGIAASLSMPLRWSHVDVRGAINLYASEPEAFTGREAALSAILAVPVEEMVANADLSFMTRDFARALPERLERMAAVDRAVGVLVARNQWTPEQAQSRLRAAASRAGVPVGEVAAVVIALHTT